MKSSTSKNINIQDINAERIKKILISALIISSKGLLGLIQKFEEFGVNEDGMLDWNTFWMTLQSIPIHISIQDYQAFFSYFDKNEDGKIYMRDLIEFLTIPLSESRKAIIAKVFRAIDRDDDGMISVIDIGMSLNIDKHPQVIQEEKPISIAFKEFIESIHHYAMKGQMNLDLFLEYIANLTCFISDAEFELWFLSLWNYEIPNVSKIGNSSVLISNQKPNRFKSITSKIRDRLILNDTTFAALHRRCREVSKFNRNAFKKLDFYRILREFNLFHETDEELDHLFSSFCSDIDNTIDLSKFVDVLRGELSDRRKNMVKDMFDKLDVLKCGFMDAEYLLSKFDASNHPDVENGKMTTFQVLNCFTACFEIEDAEGKVSFYDFLNYYADLSLTINEDKAFQRLLSKSWKLSSDYNADQRDIANTTQSLLLNQSKMEVEELNSIESSFSRITLSKANGQITNERVTAPSPRTENKSLSKSMFENSLERPLSHIKSNKTLVQNVHHGLNLIIEKLQVALRALGNSGFVFLHKKFVQMNKDQSKCVTLPEFKRCIKDVVVCLEDVELRILFDHFDVNQSGKIDFEEFMQGIRNPLNEHRLGIVELVFSLLDEDVDGVVTIDAILGKFNVAKHPDVLSGRRSAIIVMDELKSAFNQKDRYISKSEFVNYYSNVGSCLDNDDHFESLIRDSWGLSERQLDVMHKDSNHLMTDVDETQSVIEATSLTGHTLEQRKAFEIQRHHPLNGNSISPNKFPVKRAENKSLSKSLIFDESILSLPTSKTNRKTKPNVITHGLNLIIEKLQVALRALGNSGFVFLHKKFVQMNKDQSKCVTLPEFKRCIKDVVVCLEDAELRILFDHFDVNQSGKIDFEEFMQGICGKDTDSEIHYVENKNLMRDHKIINIGYTRYLANKKSPTYISKIQLG